MFPTSEIEADAHEYQCRKFRVDDFKYDVEATYLRDPAVTKLNLWSAAFVGSKNTLVDFYDPVVHWKIKGHWFKGAVPIKVRSHENNGLWIQRTDWYEDIARTETCFEVMVSESRQYAEPKTCPECKGRGYHKLPIPTIHEYMNSTTTTIDMDDIRCKTCTGNGVIDEHR